MPCRRAGEDVAAHENRRGDPLPVGDHPPRLTHQQRACADVPDAETELEEPVEDTGTDVGEVEARGARPTQVLEPGQRVLEHVEITWQALLATKGKPGGHHARAGMARHGEPPPLMVHGAVAFSRTPPRAGEGGIDRAPHRPAAL